MDWIPITAWGVAVLVAAVVLGFCTYEVAWKTKRLQRDLQGLDTLTGQLAELRARVAETQERVAAAGLR